MTGSWREQLWARAEELLGDGEWHNYEATIRELGKLVPPGVAMRKQELERIKSKTTPRLTGERVFERETGAMIASGRRTIVRVMFKSPRFESDMEGETRRKLPQRRIRMRPK